MVIAADFTAMRLHSLARPFRDRIERCPKCGRKGAHRSYRDGGEFYYHLARVGLVGWDYAPGDYCSLAPASCGDHVSANPAEVVAAKVDAARAAEGEEK